MEHLKESFLKTYANVPLQLRNDVILVHEGDPLSWRAVYLEVKQGTDLGNTFLKELKSLDII